MGQLRPKWSEDQKKHRVIYGGSCSGCQRHRDQNRHTTGQGVYFDAQGKSIIESSPRFKRGFELAQRIRAEGLDAKINPWSNEWGESLKRGTVTVQMMGAWLGGHLQNWLAPNTSGLWRSTVLPERVATSWGGTYLTRGR